tara:strand:- start:337 stop:579 length:243 start_codon:yes stop_codon:yes gene_type:complete
MYTVRNYRTKKALKADVAAHGECCAFDSRCDKAVATFQPGPFAEYAATDGVEFLEGPHYPEPHRWYAEVVLRDGLVIRVK